MATRMQSEPIKALKHEWRYLRAKKSRKDELDILHEPMRAHGFGKSL